MSDVIDFAKTKADADKSRSAHFTSLDEVTTQYGKMLRSLGDDDLVKRLREDQPVTHDMVSTLQCTLQDAAADRIEELEAENKLLSEGATIAHLRGAMDAHANRADDIWAEFKDKFDGERKYALRQIVKWLKGEKK